MVIALFGVFLMLITVAYVTVGVFVFPILLFPIYKPGACIELVVPPLLTILPPVKVEPLSLLTLPTITVVSFILSYLVSSSLFRRSKKFRVIVAVSLALTSLLAVFTLPQIVTYVAEPWVESTYYGELERFKALFSDCLNNTSPRCVFNLARELRENFTFTYMLPYPKPRQFSIDMSNLDFVRELAAVLKTGACEDYSHALTRLVEDVFGLKTRYVVFMNWDHMMPEVEVGGVWYVLDTVFTTPSHVVRVEDYAEYLNATCSNPGMSGDNICKLYEKLVRGEVKIVNPLINEDLTEQHGFSRS
ncbi:MAG: transglutaminase-like domain-containing protein [Sulfolobales archaeon]|nr:transglutaminase-like domain-containing protein [Sulfolobales archaeon]